MYTQRQLLNMNSSSQYSSLGGWIKNIDNLDDSKLYKLYATNDSSISSGRQYIAFPTDKNLTVNDYLKFNIAK
jgi:hypothetical protein